MVSIFDRLIQKLKRRKARYGERGYESKPFKMGRVDTWDYYDDVERRKNKIKIKWRMKDKKVRRDHNQSNRVSQERNQNQIRRFGKL